MTKKLEELFGLLPEEPEDESSTDMVEYQSNEIDNKNMSDRIDSALRSVGDLIKHDAEMDDIAEKALDAYEDLKLLGMNMSDAHSGKIFESAATMLKIAMDARDSKAHKKLKMIEMQIKKAKIDIDSGNYSGSSTGVEFDRNDLLKLMKKQKKEDEGKNKKSDK